MGPIWPGTISAENVRVDGSFNQSSFDDSYKEIGGSDRELILQLEVLDFSALCDESLAACAIKWKRFRVSTVAESEKYQSPW